MWYMEPACFVSQGNSQELVDSTIRYLKQIKDHAYDLLCEKKRKKKDVFNQLDDMERTQQQTSDSLNVPVARAELFCLLAFSEKRI